MDGAQVGTGAQISLDASAAIMDTGTSLLILTEEDTQTIHAVCLSSCLKAS